jgi:hypothetical protein
MNKVKEWFIKNKVHVSYCFVIFVILIAACFSLYHIYEAKKTVPIQTIQNTDKTAVIDAQKAVGKYSSDSDAADVSNLIQKAAAKPATVIYYTSTQQEADKQAQTLAKADKADYVLKQTTTANPVKKLGALTDQEIQNNYYAISQERKHRISAGATVIDSKAYATLAYTNDRMTYEIHSKDLQGVDGGSVLYTFAKW